MNQNFSQPSSSQGGPSNQGGNSPITLIAIAVGVIVVGAVAYKAMHKDAPAIDATATATAPAEAAPEKQSKVVQPHEPSAAPSAPAPVAHTAPVPATPQAKAPVTGPAKDLVTSLAGLDPKKGPITKEQAEKFKADLKALVAQGKDAVPAIREFLEKNVELNFATVGGESLGYGSLRASLIDALAQVGGPDATGALLSTLNTTALPSEIGQLARALDQIAPGQYSQDVMNAARQTLELAMSGGLGKEDTAPLYDLIQKATASGQIDPATLADLQKAAQTQKWYPVITLANAGDAGMDAIIAMSKDPNAPSTIPEILGEKAWESDKALNALIDLARAGRITPAEYQQIADLMNGKQYQITQKTDPGQPQGTDCQYFHIEWNNQNFSRCNNPRFDTAKGQSAAQKFADSISDPNVRNGFLAKLQGK
jgi:hypothetical protein